MGKKMTQEQMTIAYMKQHGSITPMDALGAFGCFRLADRVFTLKKKGYDIETVKEYKNGKRYARYYLRGEPKEN